MDVLGQGEFSISQDHPRMVVEMRDINLNLPDAIDMSFLDEDPVLDEALDEMKRVREWEDGVEVEDEKVFQRVR
jgi:hypothetical protein